MSSTLWISGGTFGAVDGLTTYGALVGRLSARTEGESRVEAPVRLAGTFGNFFVRVFSNSNNLGTTPFTVRKTGVDTALTVSFGTSETGAKEDTSHSVSFAATDTVDFTATPADVVGTLTCTARLVGVTFTPTDTTQSHIALFTNETLGTPTSVNFASSTQYLRCSGANGLQTTEANTKLLMQGACTVGNLRVVVTSNARTTDTVFKSRKNGADGAQSVTFTAAETGTKEDTSNTDTFADGDDLNYAITTNAGTEVLQFSTFATSYSATTGMWPMVLGSATGTNELGSTVRQMFVAGGIVLDANTEVNKQFTSHVAFTWKRFSINVSANTLDDFPTDFSTRVATAAGAQSLSYGSAETGVKTDTTNTDTITDGSVIDLQLSGPFATTGAITLQSLTTWGAVASSGSTAITATETLAVVLAEVGVAAVLIRGSETLAVQLTEVGVTIPAYTGTDTLPVQMTEVAVPRVLVTPTDAAPIGLTESPFGNASASSIDTLGVVLAEQGVPSVLVPASETLKAQLTEASDVRVLVTPTDSLAAVLAESAALFVTAAVVESVAVVLAESALPSVLVAAADGLAVALADATAVLVIVPSTDSLRISLTDTQAALLVIVAVADALGLTVNEAAAILVTLTASDSLAIVITETGAVQVGSGTVVSIDVADTLQLVLSEAATLRVIVAIAEQLAVQTSESAALLVLLAATDAVAVQLAEVGAVAVLLSASDATALALSEQSFVAVQISPSDAIALGMTETAALISRVAAADTVVIVLAESLFISGQAFATDAVAVQIGEQSVPLVSVAALAEALGLRVSEVSGIIENHVATENIAIAVAETQAYLEFIVATASPSGGVGGAGMKTEWIFQPRKIAIRQRWR